MYERTKRDMTRAVVYHPLESGDGWEIEVKEGIRVSWRETAPTKQEAVAAAERLRVECKATEVREGN